MTRFTLSVYAINKENGKEHDLGKVHYLTLKEVFDLIDDFESKWETRFFTHRFQFQREE